MAILDIKVPDIGDFDEVTVIELLVKPGDTVRADQSLLTVESDKASMEIPSSHAGVVKELKVALGDKVKQGSLVLLLEVAGEASAPNQPQAPVEQAPAAAASVAPAAAPAIPTPAAPVAAAAGPVEVRVPDIGDFKDVTVIEVMVQVGDSVKLEQSLVTVESDKASMEIPSGAAGVVQELKVKLGDTVNIGDLLLILQGSAAGAAPAAAVAATPNVPAAPAAQASAAPVAVASPAAVAVAPALPAHNPTALALGLPHASPSVRKFARELGVPLAEVKGTGLKGRITDADIESFTRSVMSGAVQTAAIAAQQSAKPAAAGGGEGLGLIPWPKVDFAKFGPIERKEMSRIKKISGANLLRNAIMIPAVTNHDDADITDLEAFRVSTNKENEKSGVKVTMLAFLIKACVAALKKFPDFNSSLDGDALVYKQYYHIGFAADTPNGLMVPVIKDADKKGIFQISQEMSELAKKARDGKLSPAEMSGATFTISSLGGIGGRYFTPIINAPEVAILGVCRSTMEPVWDGKAFQPRLMLPLSLTWDHRVIDGAAAARFNVYLAQILGDFRRVLL
ncbi:dihydrolipoyllysine-residue acetyltransferase [Rhodoferax fermentans]|uniref:Acetyltransferase component of pyruvate dehydrogenase complex n=1 Tax=Rhodoferax fermentans TaxID=28066 RepID=A0A1T1AUQ7_RHOFE|nr:dihydrolipoyllysine-residue acetyltransferase [Rhodoferax fermentans]MBK1683008.1 dihydrolipoyllysine-residue acetyltransferase [Rhodoferax fermentans]OOV07842.1 dihydrolipoyllysine-residue acetyltransferase [Rhodoferax fermentans]